MDERMTPPQYVAHCQETAAKDIAASTMHEGTKELSAYEELSSAFDNLFEAGLVQWRHSLANPRSTLEQAIAVAHRSLIRLPLVREYVEKLRQTNKPRKPFFWCPWQTFNLGAANLIAMLLHKQPDQRLLEIYCRPADWPGNDPYSSRDPWGVVLDSGPIFTLLERQIPAGWKEFLAYGYRSKGRGKVADQWQNYVELIMACYAKDWPEVFALFKQAEKNFRARRRWGYFDTPDGGGPFSDYVVDYRLATIIRYTLSDEPEIIEKLNTIHRWRWD